jgi:hypothetical protein
MFGVGFFVTVVSIIRLRVLLSFGTSYNLTWDYTSVGYWSTVELHTSVCCACMPAIRNLFRKFMPYVMGNSTFATALSGGAAHASGTGVSGRTGMSDNKPKFSGRISQLRTVDSDEENFIPLDTLSHSSHNKTAPLPPDHRSEASVSRSG